MFELRPRNTAKLSSLHIEISTWRDTQEVASPRLVGLGPKGASKKTNNMYYVYIIQSKVDGRLYKGFTSDLENRLKEHSEGKTKSTKGFKPWKLIYYEAFADKTDALREELFLKSGKGKSTLKEKLKNYTERYPRG